MSVGINRDYKTNARRVSTNLAKHAQLTALYIDLGLNREFASRIACEMVLTKKARNKVWRIVKVRVNSTYRYNPVGIDLFAPTSTNNLVKGDLVTVINLPGCPPANTCGQCFVRLVGDSSKAFAMVSTSSLEKQ